MNFGDRISNIIRKKQFQCQGKLLKTISKITVEDKHLRTSLPAFSLTMHI